MGGRIEGATRVAIDFTAVIVAVVGLASALGAVWIPLRWGRKMQAAEPSRAPEMEAPLDSPAEHERTRELLRANMAEIRNLFTLTHRA